MEGEDTNVEVEPVEPPADVDTDTDTDTPPADPPAEPEPKTLDEIIASGKLDWLKAQRDQLGGTKNFDLKTLERLDHNGQQAFAALLELAAEKKPDAEKRQRELDQREQELAAKERLLLQRQAGNLRLMRNDRALAQLQALREATAGEPPDEYTPEAAVYHARKAAAEILQNLFGSFEESEKELLAAHQQAEKEAAEQAEYNKEVAYIDANTDTFSDPAVSERYIVLRRDHGHGIEEAHRIALAERVSADQAETRKRAIDLARDRIQKGGRQGQRMPPKPEGLMSDPKVQAYFRDNPGALEAEFRRRFPGHDPQA